MRAASRKERAMEQDKRPRYKGLCPECGRELWICKSILMEMGINQGAGRCLHCKIFLSIQFNEEKQEMELAKFEGGSSNESIGGDLK